MNIYSGECEHGECGKRTKISDSMGAILYVGDIVALATKDPQGINFFYGISVVVDARPDIDFSGKPFIMGIASVDTDNDEGWLIAKVKGWADCINGEHWKDYGFNYRAS